MSQMQPHQQSDPKRQQTGPVRAPPPVNPHVETQKLLRSLISKIDPISGLASRATNPDQPDPMDNVIQLLQHLTGGIDQVLARLEEFETKLSETTAAKVGV